MSTVLVTGGAGFIGFHQVRALLDRGARVRVLDDLSVGDRANLHPEAELLEGSILDKELCARAVEGCDGVIHLAAMSKVGPSLEVPELCVQTNVVGTMNVALAAHRAGVRAFVFAASSTYYGTQEPPHREPMRPQALNPYGASKIMAEVMLENLHRCYGLPVCALRYFNVYGKRQPEEGAYALVMGIFLRLAGKGAPLIVDGDGSQRRDFVHVDDVVAANLLALDAMLGGDAGHHTLNIGSGSSISILELARSISSDIVFGPPRPFDARHPRGHQPGARGARVRAEGGVAGRPLRARSGVSRVTGASRSSGADRVDSKLLPGHGCSQPRVGRSLALSPNAGLRPGPHGPRPSTSREERNR